MSNITCPECKTNYFLNHFKLPFKDEGEKLHCRCGCLLYKYSRGTDSYSLEEVEEYKNQMKTLEKEHSNYPLCVCGLRMAPRTGPYGDFYRCSKYPYGCKKIVKR
jgi:predicted Zn finger-like uncharacterized protein